MTLAAGIDLPIAEMGEICRRYRVREVSVFGSAARGDLLPDSDIDLLVEFEPGSRIGLFELGDLNEELERVLRRRVDLVTRGGLRELMRGEVLREARLVYAA